ncbi:MAG: ABC-three component system protein, partial [Nitrosospira sp.]
MTSSVIITSRSINKLGLQWICDFTPSPALQCLFVEAGMEEPMITVEASAKIAGYIFQFQRVLYRLFSSELETTIVGIETEDDVVEIKQDAAGLVQIVFEQDKHSIQSSGHPFRDSSKNLWHTLHTWLDAMEAVRQKYENVSYCLVTNKEVATQAFAKKIGAADKKDEIEECIKEIRQRAIRANGESAASIKAVAAFSSENLYFLIGNLKLMDEYATASGIDAKDATIQLFQLPPDLREKAEDIYGSLIGLLVHTCQEAWVGRKQVWVEKGTFTNRLHLEISAHRMARYVERPLISTSYKDLLSKNNGDHVFLTQLQQLGVTNEQCDRALDHYWGFYSERVRLQTEGDVLPTAWDARNEQLHERWQMISDSCKNEVEVNTLETTLAKRILAKTLDGSYTAKLGVQDTSHAYFTSGNYHDLANQPEHSCFVHWLSLFAPRRK